MIKEKNSRNKINNEREVNTCKVFKNSERSRPERLIYDGDVVMDRDGINMMRLGNESNMENNIAAENANVCENFLMNQNESYSHDYINSDNSFDFNKLFKSLQFSKIHLEKFSTFHKPRVNMK